MRDRDVLAREQTPNGEIQLQRLNQKPPVYEIIFNGVFMVASYNQLSERRLATLAIEPLSGKNLRVLIGGLGIGYTLQATLAHQTVGAVEVVELDEHIIEWNKRFFGELNGHALSDPRVRLIQMDFARYLDETTGTYQAIVLDLDNGPNWLVLESNGRMYSVETLRKMRGLLEAGGVLTVWSAERDGVFRQRLQGAFEQVDEIVINDLDQRGRPVDYFVYRARKGEEGF